MPLVAREFVRLDRWIVSVQQLKRCFWFVRHDLEINTEFTSVEFFRVNFELRKE